MNGDFISGIWLGICLSYSARAFWNSRRKKNSASAPEVAASVEPPSKRVEAPQTAQTQKWFAVPGERIELGTSGFYIELEDNEDDPPYCGYSPEGFLYGKSRELHVMKAYIEDRAIERTEFAPQTVNWMGTIHNKRHSP